MNYLLTKIIDGFQIAEEDLIKKAKEMNIKSLRKNYDGLTMLERLALADNAESRDDESEIRAINEASPKESFRQVDFYDLMKGITTFRLCNLIVRLSYAMQFDFFSTFAELEILKDKTDKTKYKKHSDNARMAAFLFVRAKDSWQAVNDELGLRPDYDEDISENLFRMVFSRNLLIFSY